MGVCETCGNDYDKTFEIVRDGESHTFDCFECAIEAMAPACSGCGTRMIGHGVEVGGSIFCSAHCAKQTGETAVRDRA